MTNFKIKVTPQESEIIQKLIFLIGGGWGSNNRQIVDHCNYPYLFYRNNIRSMTKGSSKETHLFIGHEFIELTFEQFLDQIELELNNINV